ncbi:adiponectin-like [Scleropages formosus]|uniref:Adiponectin-like n=1 Tax=Scleropages formosus TaxID=113540 RepID=A0A0P7UX24_SCLFO|nr:adiponectin-like [Scleropages formosus]
MTGEMKVTASFLWVLLIGLLLGGRSGHAQDEDQVEPESPVTDVQAPDDRQPCAQWMGGVPGTPGHSGLRGFPGTPGLKGERGESALMYHSSFSVGLTDPVHTTNVPIRFTKFFHNEQRHYDDVSGKFRCALPGVYFFTYHLTIYPRDARVSLYKNDRTVMFTYDQFKQNNLDQASGSIILHLETGDEVWLQVYGEEEFGGVYADNINDSTFSGFLLYPDIPTADRRR